MGVDRQPGWTGGEAGVDVDLLVEARSAASAVARGLPITSRSAWIAAIAPSVIDPHMIVKALVTEVVVWADLAP
ncbi:MAG: hypothetical protein V2I33_22280, partial [Kangiellaceae bacterium]|nr:hypothetical protein [Kangiellaceae bacterium]